MKYLILTLSLAAVGVSSASAQIYQPTVVRDSVIGAVAGALIGGHNHDRWAEGAVIGAAAGALVGATVDQPRTVVYAQPVVQTTVVADAPQAPMAPVVGAPPAQVVYVAAPAPQVVYVRSYPRPVCYEPAPVFISASWSSGPYWRGYGYPYYRGYGRPYGGPGHHHGPYHHH